MKKGKRYLEAAKLIEKNKAYEVEEAMKLVLQTGTAKFDETVELHMRLGVDPKHADQQVRGVVVLPNGTGKSVKVLVIAKGAKADEAAAAGADYVGAEEIIAKIQNEGWIDFDVCVATPDMMGELGKLGRVLGPKGLMPNPKSGTVTMDVTKAVAEIKAGKITKNKFVNIQSNEEYKAILVSSRVLMDNRQFYIKEFDNNYYFK